MFTINRDERDLVKLWTETENEMKRPPEFAGIIQGIMRRLQRWIDSSYLDAAGHWALHMDRWLSNNPLPDIQRGQVVNVDLGVNYEGEMSYVHPCVVLRASGNWAIIVPVTSRRFGNGILVDVGAGTIAANPSNTADEYKNQIDFVMPKTGVPSSTKVDQVRMISKQRVIDVWRYPAEEGRLGALVQVHGLLLQAIDEKVTMLIAPSVRHKVKLKEKAMKELQTEHEQEIRKLQADLQVATNEAGRLAQMVRELQAASGKEP